jgi:non-reducing end alpha-L-arabinofuranosidase
LAPAATARTHAGPQTFTPGSSRDFIMTFTNTTGAPAADVSLTIAVPSKQWTAVVSGTTQMPKMFAQQIAPGASVSATFKITSGPVGLNGDLIGTASWTNATRGRRQIETTVEKFRNARPIKINEFRVNSGSPGNPTDSFIELYNAGSQTVDLSNWTLTEHPAHQAIFSTVKIPAGTKLAVGGFYLLGLSNSGLAVPAHAGGSTIHVRNTDGVSIGDTINIGTGSSMEARKIASLGTAASSHTTLWQSLPEELVITVPAGSTNVPVEDASGFVVGQKIALGYGSTYPIVANTVEQYEIATVTAVGQPGTQAYLAMEAPARATNIQVTSLANISTGDKIRLDIDSVGHGIETVTVAHVGTAASQTNLSAPANAGATRISVRRAEGFGVGDKITVGRPTSQEVVRVTAVGNQGPDGAAIDFTPALAKSHVVSEWVVSPGTGLDLAAPLRFNHSANLPFSDRGTGISFQPATAFAHSSNEPVQALGTGITLDRPLTNNHPIYAAVRDAAVKTAGYQGMPTPNQWFGGPELTTKSPQFGRILTVEEGSIVLREPSGVVADSLNYGGLVDPWAAEGDQAVSGTEISGCYAPAPGSVFNPWSTVVAPVAINTSTGRFPDGADTDSNCTDFSTQAAASLSTASDAGATNIKVASTEGFRLGQTIRIDSGANAETAILSTVGTAGATTLRSSTSLGATMLPAAGVTGFSKGQTITIDEGQNSETAVVSSTRVHGGASITVVTPLARGHAAGVQISGSGISLTTPLTRPHTNGAQVSDHVPTPGAPNQYQGKNH